MMRVHSVGLWTAAVAIVAVAICGAGLSASTDPEERTRVALAPSPEARSRIEALRERFRTTVRDDRAATGSEPSALGGADTERTAVIGAGIARGFVPSGVEAGSVRVLIPPDARRGIARTASVDLPRAATGFARLEDDTSHLSVRFALRDANDAPISVTDGVALYAGALDGADVVHRAHAEGTEDFVVFEERPPQEELYYVVDVSRVAGLRLVSNTLEFLDGAGSPRLRIAPPYVVDAAGERHEATLAVEGCAYDRSPAAPRGRPVSPPGAAECTVRVAWEGVPYPAVVDPSWTATGSMAEGRSNHTASVLESGNVLIAGGFNATAELYDPVAGTFSATGSMAQARGRHTASVLESGLVLVVGGADSASGSLLATAELYDPVAGTFSATGSMAEPRPGHTASVLGSGLVLVAGAYYCRRMGGCVLTATAELYDPATGTFSATGSMTDVRGDHTASMLASGRVLIAGGYGPEPAELYDPVAGTFSATGSILARRVGHTASVLGSGNVLVAGGSGGLFPTAELYDPVAGTFSATRSMAEPRGGHTASVLESGLVLVAGGEGDSATAELYDPMAGTFSATRSMTEPRSGHTASVLESGLVLVVGGFNSASASSLATAELYDPTAPDPVADAGTGAGVGAASGGCGCVVLSSTATPAPGSLPFLLMAAFIAALSRRGRSASGSRSGRG